MTSRAGIARTMFSIVVAKSGTSRLGDDKVIKGDLTICACQ